MPDDRALPPGAPSAPPRDRPLGSRPEGAPASTAELSELRDLLFGVERRQIDELRRRLDTFEPSAEELAEHLPEAVALRAARDQQLALALAPTIEDAIGESVRRNPREIAAAIFPVIGPAIRKAIAETMAGLVNTINRAIEHSVSPRGLRWRFEAWRTGVPFAEIVIKHALVYLVEQVFLIHAETGLLLEHVPEESSKDGDVISGMLTAIRDFVTDSFAPRETGEMRRFNIGDVSVLAETGPRAYLAAVVRGQPPDSLRERLETTLETIHLQFSTALASFAGNTAPFADARPLLEDCLETVLSTDRSRPRAGMARFAWAIPVVLAIALIGALWMRSNRQWSRAVASLEQEPGIVVVRAERDGGRWRFAGLRDPLAASPAAVLAAAGGDTTKLDARWEPYVSTQPPLVLARARRILAPPASLTLDLAGDTLVARGQATRSWLQRAATIAPTFAGVSHLSLTSATPALSAEAGALRREAEAVRVLFAIGSARLDSAAGAAVATAADALARLRAAAAADGFPISLVLTGRTDTIGTEATNLDLGRRRAVATRAALIAAGVPADIIEVRSVGSREPLAAPEAASRAQVNRSVSLSIVLPDDSPAAPGPAGDGR